MEISLNNEWPKGRSAFITGGASGIGKATSLAFARAGAQVLLADTNGQGGEETVAEIRNLGGVAVFQKVDVTKEKEVQDAIDRTVSEFGQLDIAFNNAGIEGPEKTTEELSLQEWNRVLDVNLTGIWLCMKYEIEKMLKQKSGCIINCASIAGLIGFAQMPAYVASKHGVIGLTKTAALELAQKNIRVNAICPGAIQTPMIDRFVTGRPEALEMLKTQEPMGRLGQPEEIASAALWLSSMGSSFVTGQCLTVDGGWLAG